MRFIGLDVAYRNVGVVVLDHAGVCVDRQHLRCKEDAVPEAFTWHRVMADRWLVPGDVVAIEGLSFGSIGKTHVLAGAHAYWLEAAVRQGHLVLVPVPMRVKLWALDSVKATKAEMIAWARTALALDRTVKLSEHEADALALAQLAQAGYNLLHAGKDPALTDRQRTIFHTIKSTGLLQAEGRSFYWGANGKREAA